MKLHKILLITILHFLVIPLYAQIHDRFAELDTLPGHWSGDRILYIVNNNGELQLSASEAGDSFLSTPINRYFDLTEWVLTVRIPFAPSANNYLRLWLMADRDNLLDDNVKGLFLQFGENGTQDAIELCWKESRQEIVLCRGENGRIATAFHLSIKVLKENDHWRIYVDELLNDYFKMDADVVFSTDNLYFMGISCHYTGSNANRFFFNEIYYGEQRIDTIPAIVELINPQQNLHSIRIRFSKALSPDQIVYNENFAIIENGEQPVECKFYNGNYTELELRFSTPFLENIPYHLEIKDLLDVNGNEIADTLCEIVFSEIRRHDVVIHEIMAAPRPMVGLPDAEYIEIYNRKNTPVVLSNWQLQIGKTLRGLPEIALGANGYAVIVAEANRQLFSDLNNCYGIPSMSITDAGQQFTLYDENHNVIHSLVFKSTWHQETVKRNGGWSLEMMDSENPCHGVSNWGSSVSGSGGTPGYANSISRANPDRTPPEIERISLVDASCAQLFFTEEILLDNTIASDLFQIDRGIEIISVEEMPPDFRSLLIRFSSPIAEDKIYTLTVQDTLCDCVGWMVATNSSIRFGLPSTPAMNDLVVNEILATSTNKGNYIEIYNRSSKIIDLKDVLLGSGGDTIPKKAVTAVSGGCLLFPESYWVICENKEIVMTQFYTPYPERLATNDSFPTFAKSSGTVFLTDRGLKLIDKVKYDDEMHYVMLVSINDVSLERVNFTAESGSRGSWKSAAASSGYGTPGYKNSQFCDIIEINDAFVIDPEILSPDNDGFDDYTIIHCSFDDPENRVSITIHDQLGNPVKSLVNNQHCGTEARFLWDGTTNQENIAPPGLYVIFIEYWNHNGKSKRTRRVVGVK